MGQFTTLMINTMQHLHKKDFLCVILVSRHINKLVVRSGVVIISVFLNIHVQWMKKISFQVHV